MYHTFPKTCIKRKPTEQGESIEEMVRRCTESNEPIDCKAPMIYTDRAEGVMPQYDIRTDRFEIALDAMDKYQKSELARQKEQEPKEAEANKGEEANKQE